MEFEYTDDRLSAIVHRGARFVRERECVNDDGEGNDFRCSKCGCTFLIWQDDWTPALMVDNGDAVEPNFCPSCGRRVAKEARR